MNTIELNKQRLDAQVKELSPALTKDAKVETKDAISSSKKDLIDKRSKSQLTKFIDEIEDAFERDPRMDASEKRMMKESYEYAKKRLSNWGKNNDTKIKDGDFSFNDVKNAMGDKQQVRVLKKNGMLEYEGTVGDISSKRKDLVDKNYEKMGKQGDVFVFKMTDVKPVTLDQFNKMLDEAVKNKDEKTQLDIAYDDDLSDSAGVREATNYANKLGKKHNCKVKLISKRGPGGGWPVFEFEGSKEDIKKLENEYGY